MSPNVEGRNKGQCETYVWQYYLKYNNTTYLLLLLVVPSQSINYLSSMPLVGSQLCSWQMMTCQQMTGIMDYVRITCEKGIERRKMVSINHTHLQQLRANMTGPLGISIETDSALWQDVIVETVGKDVGEPVGASVPSSSGSVSDVVGKRVGAGLV